MNVSSKLLFLFALVAAIALWQCDREIADPHSQMDSSQMMYGKGGNGGGGNGGSGGGGNGGSGGGQGGGAGVYGDLLVVLRDADGLPLFVPIDDEHGTKYYAQPIKHEEVTEKPVRLNDSYAVFALNEEGEMIPEVGYIAKEVEFGRLNVVRAPQSVLDQARGEAVTALTQPTVINIITDVAGRLMAVNGQAEDWLVNYDNDPGNDEFDDKIIDSPRENMAIYQELMTYGFTRDLDILANYFSEADILDLAVGAFAGGADKTGSCNVDEVCYLNGWNIDWTMAINPALGPDEKGNFYYDFGDFSHSRFAKYSDKWVRETVLRPDGTWGYVYNQLSNVVPWTNPEMLIDYAGGNNYKVTGFANAVDDAIRVIEYLHDSPLVEYSPYFTPAP